MQPHSSGAQCAVSVRDQSHRHFTDENMKLKKQTDMMDDAGEKCMKTLHFYSLSVSLFNLFLPPLPPSAPAGLIISLQLLRGDMEQVRRENPLIFSRGVAMTRKLGFPDVIMPGESMASTSD